MTIYVSFGTSRSRVVNGVPQPMFNPTNGTGEAIAIGAKSAGSSAESDNDGVVRIHTTEAVICEIGPQASVSASATSPIVMAAGDTEYFPCANGDGVDTLAP